MGLVVDSTVFVGAERKNQTVVALLEALQQRFGDEEIVVSALSAGELLHGVWRASTPVIRAARQQFVEEVFVRTWVRNVNLNTARIAAQIDAQARAKGKVIPATDLWIGSTALELGFSLVSANFRHFKMIPGLKTTAFPHKR